MFIDNYNQEFSEFAEEYGYEVVSVQKRQRKEATFDVCLKVKGTNIEFDFVVTDYEFKSTTHRTRGLSEKITKQWQSFVEKKEGDIYSLCLKNDVKFLPF